MARHTRFFACLCAASALVQAPAHAEPPRPAPISVPPMPDEPSQSSGAVARAKQLFARGAAAYDAGRYYEAIEIFTETDRLYPNPQLAFNVGKAYDALGSQSGGLRYYRDYLRRAPEASDRASVEARIRELEAALADQGLQQLTVITDPPDALLVLDGRPVGLTPWTGLTWPGKHRVELRRERSGGDQFVTEVSPHRSAEVKVVLREAQPTDAAALKHLPPRPARPVSAARIDAVTWAALITGGAALGTALAIEAASPASSDTIRPGTAFFAGLGTAAALTGGILLYLRSSEPPPVTPGARAGLAVRVGRSSCSAKYTGRF